MTKPGTRRSVVISMRKDLNEDSDKCPPPAYRSRSRARLGDERSLRPGRDAAFATQRGVTLTGVARQGCGGCA